MNKVEGLPASRIFQREKATTKIQIDQQQSDLLRDMTEAKQVTFPMRVRKDISEEGVSVKSQAERSGVLHRSTNRNGIRDSRDK